MLRRTRTFAQKLFQPKTNGGAPFLALAFLCWKRDLGDVWSGQRWEELQKASATPRAEDAAT